MVFRSLALSLPQSSPLNPERLDSFAPSPLAARASAIRSRTCGRQRLAFLAVSATGGARKPNPSEGGEGAPAPCAEFLLVSIKNRGWCGFSPRVGIFTKIYIKNSPPHSKKTQKESSGPFAVGYSEKTPGTAVQRAQAFPRPTANGSCGGSIPQNACFGKEDSNERNPSGVCFCSSRLCLAGSRVCAQFTKHPV